MESWLNVIFINYKHILLLNFKNNSLNEKFGSLYFFLKFNNNEAAGIERNKRTRSSFFLIINVFINIVL